MAVGDSRHPFAPLRCSRPHNRRTQRYPFDPRKDFYFSVPLALYGSGWATRLSGNEFKRYVTLLRVSNFRYGKKQFQASQKYLMTLDGLPERTAKRVHGKLEEYGLIRIFPTNPRTFVLLLPEEWVSRGCVPLGSSLEPLSAEDVGFAIKSKR